MVHAQVLQMRGGEPLVVLPATHALGTCASGALNALVVGNDWHVPESSICKVFGRFTCYDIPQIGDRQPLLHGFATLKYEAMWIEFLTQGFDVMRIYGKGDLDLLIRDLDILFESLDPDNMPIAFLLTAADFTAKEPLPLLPAPPPAAGAGDRYRYRHRNRYRYRYRFLSTLH